MTPSLSYAARSHTGMVRENNEDSAYAAPRVLVLADGMGGHAAGELASQIMVATLARLDEDQPGSDLAGALSRAMNEGNRAIAAHVEAHPEADGMGCTLTALLFDGRRMGLLHVGDSRAYLLRDGVLTQITKDDTFVQSLVDRGELTAEEAHVHPRRSLILKALTGEPVEPTTAVREARVGDRYLLCSDGLSDPVSTETIAETLATGSADAAAERLVQLALRSGGPDNVTVVVADVVDSPRGGSIVPVVVGAASTDEPGEIAVNADTAAGRAAAFSRAQVASQNGTGGAEDKADEGTPAGSTEQRAADESDPAAPRGTRWRFAVSVVGVIVLIAGLVGVSALLVRSNYFVAEEDSQVVVKRGISGEVFGISLASVSQKACLTDDDELTLHDAGTLPSPCNVFTIGDLSEPARESVRAGMPSGSLADARAQIFRLAQDNLLPPCAPRRDGGRTTDPAETITSPSPTTTSPTTSPGSAPEQSPERSPEPTPRPSPAPVPGVDCRAVS
ncbi:potassium ABC transporter ATPase [Dietzia sp. UCD-THP]|uniref:Serine/threonine protein phosphatase PstP n=1 Tax=Dietzia natronolimnaea TaxID=161920 RepID=A0A2A2WRS2_9ACTN|nr:MULTISPECIES: protein phosphatase 2C domain-containing protein [Dietzia]EYT65589.1 potassium ABC transporter ATPase [Dietzia sp. UCD-THP]PAY23887.1 serine/threonine-protein phosphatase [Dietzia natronolimnaea]